jgi:bifunctional non-homologous end joining protein LigD
VSLKQKAKRSGAGRAEPGKKTGRSASVNVSDAPKAPMPRNIRPMLASPVEQPFDRPDWLFEVKWDGYRAIAEVEDGGVRLYSRNMLSFHRRYLPIVNSLERLKHDAVLDGEIVVVDDKGKPRFQLLQSYQKTGQGALVYQAFDLLYLDGHDLRNLPLLRRKELLAALLDNMQNVKLSEHVQEHGIALYKAVSEAGLEGIVAKDARSRYREGTRSQSWLKIKTHRRHDAVIGGFTEPKGGRLGLGSLVLGVYDGSDLVYIGHTGTGFTDKSLAAMRSRLEGLIVTTCPFKQRPKTNGPVHWVEPRLVCEVSFGEWTDEGYLRHPVFQGLREDKDASTVRRDRQPVNTVVAATKETKARAVEVKNLDHQPKQQVTINGHTVHLTNLTKVYWPDDGYTKGDLIRYYREVSKAILPYLRDRVLSLNRHPNGIHGANFFQKDMRQQPPPDWVETVEIESDGKKGRSIVCQDEATLVYLANLGCIELNPLHARTTALDKPDYVMLDLDPESISFDHVVEAAQTIRAVLEDIGAAAYCKTSGKRGLHVYVPFGACYSHDQAKHFAELIAHIVHAQLPATTSLVRNPAGRQGRVYLDYLQNGNGKTLAAAYCVRPYPKATASTSEGLIQPGSRSNPSSPARQDR